MLCLFSFTCFLSIFFFLKKQAYKLYLVSCPSVSLLSLVLVPFLSTNPPPTFTVCLQNCLKINDQPMFPTISTNHLGADDDNGGGFRAFSGNVYGFCGGFGYWMMMIVAIVFLGFGDVPAHLLSCANKHWKMSIFFKKTFVFCFFVLIKTNRTLVSQKERQH